MRVHESAPPFEAPAAYRRNGLQEPETARRSSPERLRAAKALFLLAAGVSFLFSVYLWFLVDREQGLFVGLWVPSILSLGGLMLAGKGGRRE